MREGIRVVPLGTIGRPAQPTGSGGTEKFIYFITRYLAGWGHDVSVIDVKSVVHVNLPTAAKFHEVNVMPAAGRGLVRHLIRAAFFCTAAVLRLRSLHKKKRIDIIHTHTQFPAAAVMLAKKIFRWKVPVVHSVHNPTLLLEGLGNKLGNLLENCAIKSADFVTTDTEYVRRELVARLGLDAGRTAQVYSGMDTESINDSVRAGASGISGRVRFTGEIPQETLYELYKQAVVFVFPTLNETQGLAVIEAMAFGLPVVASRIGPITDVGDQEPGGAILMGPAS